MTTVDDLRLALEDYHRAHGAAEIDTRCWLELQKEYKNCRAYVSRVVAEMTVDGKPAFSNAEKREAEVQRRMEREYRDQLDEYEFVERRKRDSTAALERAFETLKTLRALLLFETADIQLRAAEIAARAAVRYEIPADLPF